MYVWGQGDEGCLQKAEKIGRTCTKRVNWMTANALALPLFPATWDKTSRRHAKQQLHHNQTRSICAAQK